MFRFRDRFKYFLERWLQRGVGMLLLFVAGIIVAISLAGGLIAWAFSPQFDEFGAAAWWAFLRLSDPGYLGDDEGALLRTLSTIITVLGYVVFLGSLVAILTQWLNTTMRKLESGLTPITIRDHVLILGWTNRTPTIVQELMLSETRVRRFLERRGARKLRIVILAEQVTRELMIELRETAGVRWNERRVILRSGTSLRVEHLRRVAYRDASVIIVPGADFHLGGAAATDARVIKTLISLAPDEKRGGDPLREAKGDRDRSSDGNRTRPSGPSVVAEIFDAQKLPVAENAYRDGRIDIVSSDSFISRLIAQNVRHPGLSHIYGELLSHRRGNEVYVRSLPQLAGRTFGSCVARIDRAVALGIVRPDGERFVPYLNPSPDRILQADDRLVFIARSYAECEPGAVEAGDGPAEGEFAEPVDRDYAERRVLLLGWSHKVAALLQEFSGYEPERFRIDVLSRIPVSTREAALGGVPKIDGMEVRHVEGDYTRRDVLVSTDPGGYDNVVFLASDWLDTEEESDARTILGYVLLRALLDEDSRRPEVLIELMDPENARLFRHRRGEVIISPVILSHIVAHVALRSELNAVFNHLFGPGGAEFSFRTAAELGVQGRPVTMRTLRDAAVRRGDIALGIRLRSDFERTGAGVYLNPPKDRRWNLQPEDEIVVLTDT